MEESNIEKLYKMLENIPVTEENEKLLEKIKNDLDEQDYENALNGLKELGNYKVREEKNNINENNNGLYPKELSNVEIEHKFIGLLLTEPKQIVKYYFLYDDCYFEDEQMLNIYKSILYTEGGKYTLEVAKQGFNFSKDSEQVYKLKGKLKNDVRGQNYNMEKIYMDLKKLFLLRKNYLAIPIEEIQKKIIEIKSYILYDKMSVEEVQSAIIQVNDTGKFKRAVLNKGLSSFLRLGDNNLTNGLPLPFPILTSVFKGIRKGETMAFAMPSNSGKSRFTIDIAANVALVHKEKVLVISNEMSEEKMRLCLITTIINNKEIQKVHGIELSKTEGELLEFKFRPDNINDVEVDDKGYVLRRENETQIEFADRLSKVSTEYNKTIQITDWANKEILNSIYFINITDQSNNELLLQRKNRIYFL